MKTITEQGLNVSDIPGVTIKERKWCYFPLGEPPVDQQAIPLQLHKHNLGWHFGFPSSGADQGKLLIKLGDRLSQNVVTKQ